MKKYFSIILFLLMPVLAFGQVGQNQNLGPTEVGGTAKVAQSGAQFLQVGVSARSTGMGDAFLGIADDASAAYYNPGALARIAERQFMFTQTSLPADINHFFGSVVYPLSGDLGTVALHTIILTTGDMPVTRSFVGPTGESFSCSEIAVGFSYSKNLTDRFSVGGTGKYIQQDLAGYTARGWGVDFGTFYLVGFRDLRFGMTIRNFGPDMKFGDEKDIGFDSQEYALPMDFRFGISMSLVDMEDHNLKMALQVSQPNDNLRNESMGAEYTLMDMLIVRGGYKMEFDGEDISFGAGLKVPFGSVESMFDFSWVRSEDLEDLMRFSVAMTF